MRSQTTTETVKEVHHRGRSKGLQTRTINLMKPPQFCKVNGQKHWKVGQRCVPTTWCAPNRDDPRQQWAHMLWCVSCGAGVRRPEERGQPEEILGKRFPLDSHLQLSTDTVQPPRRSDQQLWKPRQKKCLISWWGSREAVCFWEETQKHLVLRHIHRFTKHAPSECDLI